MYHKILKIVYNIVNMAKNTYRENDKSTFVESKFNGSHITLYNMLQRDFILFNVINGMIQLGKAQPALIIFII